MLEDHAKATINNTIENDVLSRCLAWYVSPSLSWHAGQLHSWLFGEAFLDVWPEFWGDIFRVSDSAEWETSVLNLAISYYVASPSFDAADRRFNEAIRPFLPKFDLACCMRLIQGIEDNGQTWGRRSARIDHLEVLTRLHGTNPQADLAQFQNFNRNLG